MTASNSPQTHGAALSGVERAGSEAERRSHFRWVICDAAMEKVQGVPWMRLFPRKETWTFAIAKFLTDPIWWFYLFWLPRYLQGTFHLNLSQSQKPIVACTWYR